MSIECCFRSPPHTLCFFLSFSLSLSKRPLSLSLETTSLSLSLSLSLSFPLPLPLSPSDNLSNLFNLSDVTFSCSAFCDYLQEHKDKLVVRTSFLLLPKLWSACPQQSRTSFIRYDYERLSSYKYAMILIVIVLAFVFLI